MESRATRRADGSRGWFATLLGLSVLAVLGFGVGLLVGGFWEEPELMASHLLGGTDAVALPVAELAGEPPRAAAAARDEAGEAPARAPGAHSPPAPPVAAAPPTARMAVQVGAFGDSRAAQQLAERLRSKGFRVYLSAGAGSEDTRWRVRVGPLGSREQAQRVASRLKTEEKLPTWILDEG